MGDGVEAGRAGHTLVAHGAKLGVRLAQDRRGGIDCGNLPFSLAQSLIGRPLEQRHVVEVVVLGYGDAVLDQATAGDEQLFHVAERYLTISLACQRI